MKRQMRDVSRQNLVLEKEKITRPVVLTLSPVEEFHLFSASTISFSSDRFYTRQASAFVITQLSPEI